MTTTEGNNKVIAKKVGGLVVTFEYIKSEMATEVSIEGETLCWIDWDNVEDITKKLNKVIDEYSI